MGCLWSAAMIQHLQDKVTSPVTLLLRDSDALDRYPGMLTVESSNSGFTSTNSVTVPALPVSDTRPGSRRFARLLLSCKAHDAAAALASVADFIDDQSIIVLLQNGVNFQQQLSSTRPAGTVFSLSTSYGAWLRKPFHTVAAGSGESWLGHLYTRNTPALEQAQRQLLAELPQAAMNISIDNNMSQRLWEKLAINCAINGLTVIYNCRNGELLTNPVAREHCELLCREITQLMHQIPRAPEMPELWLRVQQVTQATALNISSTLQDIRQQRRTEIEHLNGYLCDLARQYHLPCPLNQQVLAAVLESARLTKTTPSSVV